MKYNTDNFSFQLNEDATLNIKIKKNTKITKKTYSDIIPSPVKIIMNSPLKCPVRKLILHFINILFKA